jgi:hypothetical protein
MTLGAFPLSLPTLLTFLPFLLVILIAVLANLNPACFYYPSYILPLYCSTAPSNHLRLCVVVIRRRIVVWLPFDKRPFKMDRLMGSKALAAEVRILLQEVGKLRDEKRALQFEVAELLATKVSLHLLTPQDHRIISL